MNAEEILLTGLGVAFLAICTAAVICFTPRGIDWAEAEKEAETEDRK